MSPRVKHCLFAVSILNLVVVIGCSDDGTGGQDAGLDLYGSSDASNTTSIGPSGGVFSFHDGKVKLEVPKGTLDGEIFVRVLRADSYPQELGLVQGTVYDLLPEGTVFKKPVKLTIAYLGSKVPKGTPEAELRIHKVISNSWHRLPGGVDRNRWTAWANLMGFSKYGVKGPKPLAQPDAPKPQDAADMGTPGTPDKGAADAPGSTCGNGKVDGKEACDGADLGGKTCNTEGFAAGTLACSKLCTLDTSKCTTCGNGKIDGKEACDGTNLGGKTCATTGHVAGTLACTKLCTLDTSKCTWTCGNKKCEFGEDAFLCSADCGSAKCGDSSLLAGEQCDGKLLGGHTCKSLGFSGGTLTCAEDCTLSSDKCTSSGCSAADLADCSYAISDSETGSAPNKVTLSQYFGSPAMVVDPKGRIHLLFHKNLEYVTDQSGTWKKKALNPGGTVDRPALALDATGKAHVAYRDDKGTLYYQTNTSGKWVTETVTTGVKSVSLVAGSATDVGIAYSTKNNWNVDLSFARRSGKAWKHVGVAKDVSTIGNLVRDKAGKVYIAAGKSGSLQVFQEQATGWISLTKLTAQSPSNLVVDAKGALHLLFRNSGLFHATNSKGSWSTTKLNIPATNLTVQTMAADAAGNLYFAAKGSNQGGWEVCIEKAFNITDYYSFMGSCSIWPLVIYSNASGAWKASALAFENYSGSGKYGLGLNYSYHSVSAGTTIHGIAIHGARLHFAYSRAYDGLHEKTGYYYSEIMSTTNGHMIKCL